MRGIPLRVEIGPRDLAENKCVVVRRDTREKIACSIDELPQKVAELLPQIQGSRECEEKIKEDYSVTSRCIPYKQEKLSDVCVCCGKPATKMVYWGRAY